MRKILLLMIMVSNFVFSQNKDYYTLEKKGNKYPKIVRYVFLNNGDKIIQDRNIIFFNIKNQRFKYIKNYHKTDTCSFSSLKKIKIITIDQLIKDEYKEHLKRTKENNLKIPAPLNHYNSKVFIIEKVSSEKIIKYEVEWIYSID
ncbi:MULTISPECIES: BTB/POZ domain-containing protein [Flavobacterium]|jgi:hypothetical protein|uniref:Uncharacterized protein n=1 Tax=Flavobacterium salmonis TaxID=2654844 RepID=A0A6V6Z5M9_9FLAO|nr:hypothetical protein [Flavobacterium salmonis]CAD0006232.1 hypothetical protein FLAT13_03187 [Flavobacterium salmonis]